MATTYVELTHGKKMSVDCVYEDDDGVVVDLSSGYSAEMKLRVPHKSGSGFSDKLLDTLSTANGRITLAAGSGSPAVNITLDWSTVQAQALPNRSLFPVGTVELTTTADDEVVESFDIPFQLYPSTTE